MNPQSRLGATLGTVRAVPWQYLDWVKKAEFQAESVIEAEAGKSLHRNHRAESGKLWRLYRRKDGGIFHEPFPQRCENGARRTGTDK